MPVTRVSRYFPFDLATLLSFHEDLHCHDLFLQIFSCSHHIGYYHTLDESFLHTVHSKTPGFCLVHYICGHSPMTDFGQRKLGCHLDYFLFLAKCPPHGDMGVPSKQTEISKGRLDDKAEYKRYKGRIVRGRKTEQHFHRVFDDDRTRLS